MAIVISPKIRDKLARKHNVKPEEVEQCFANRNGNYILEVRKQHEANVPTYWFIAETNYRRRLKVVFISEHGNIYLKSAFEPTDGEVENYLKYGGETI